MDSIQEMIDEHKMEMSEALAKKLLDACMAKAEAEPKLYKLTWTTVNSHAHVVECEDEPDFPRVELSHQTQTLIVEAIDHLPDGEYGGKVEASQLPNRGLVLKSWVTRSTPFVMTPYGCYDFKDHLEIIHTIEPYEPHKRAREE